VSKILSESNPSEDEELPPHVRSSWESHVGAAGDDGSGGSDGQSRKRTHFGRI